MNSATPVQFDIAGGINFNNRDLEISGDGPIIMYSEVNNLNIEALSGRAYFQGEDMFISSFGGDIVFESIREDVLVSTERGVLDFAAPSISVEGNFRYGGVNLTSNGPMSFSTANSVNNGNFEFTGHNINVDGDGGIIANARDDADMLFFALDKTQVDSHGPMNIAATNMLEIRSLSGPMNIEAAQFSIQSPDLFYEATGSTTIASALGELDFNAAARFLIQSADQVKFTSNEDGIHAVSSGNVEFSAGDRVDISSSIADSAANLSAESDISLSSLLDSVELHANENFVAKITGDFEVTANQDAHITAQNSYSVTTTGQITHDIERNFVMSGQNLLSFDAQNSSLEFDIDDDMYVLGDTYTTYTGVGIDIQVGDDADFEIQGDLIFEIADDLSFTFDNSGVLSGEFEMDMKSTGASKITVGDDMTVNAGDSVNINSGNMAVKTNNGDLTVTSPLYATYLATNLFVFTEDDLSFTSNGGIYILAEDDLDVTSSDTIDFSSSFDTDIYMTDLEVNAQSDINIETSRDTHFFVHDKVEFKNDRATNSKTTFTAGSDMRMESGTFNAVGVDLDVTSQTMHIFVRDSQSLTATGTFDFDANSIAFESTGETFTISADDSISIATGGEFQVISDSLFHGDISFTSTQGDISFDVADDVDIEADRFEFYGNKVDFTANSFTLEHTANRGTDYGNIILSSVGVQTHRSDSITSSGERTEYHAVESISVLGDGGSISISANSNDDVIMEAADNVSVTAIAAIEIVSSNVEFFGVDSGSIESNTASIDANDLQIHSAFNLDFTAVDDVTISTANDLVATSTNSVSITGGNVDIVSSNAITIDENGNGSEFNAANDITQTMTNNYVSADSLISFNAKNGKLDLDGADEVQSVGGQQEIYAQSDYSLFSQNTISIATNDNGFLSFTSGRDILSTASTFWQLLGSVSSLTETPGRFGTIRSNADDANICVSSNNVDRTRFHGDSIVFTASGPDATFNSTSIKATNFQSTEGGIGINVYGNFPEDPQFLFEDDVTFGLIFRTAPGNSNGISVQSTGADIASYADRRFFISSNTSGLQSESTSGETEFRTYGFNATINVVTDEGTLAIMYDNTGIFTAGNPYLPADMNINATRNIEFTSGDFTEWVQYGTTTVPDGVGILVESFDLMSFDAGDDFTMRALDGGILRLETREDDISFTTTQSFKFTAETGSIDMISRGESTFNALGGDISFEAAGDGGSVFLQSGGEEIFQILATDTKLFFEAEQGEIDFQTEEGFFATVVGGNSYDANCINIEGGSVFYEATAVIQFTSTEDINFDAEREFTVDASTIDITGVQVNVNAGGTSVSPGITGVSVGDIVFDSNQGSVGFNATQILGTATNAVTINAGEAISFKSELDSLETTAISVLAQNGAGTITADQRVSTAKLTQSTTSANLITDIETFISLSAARELKMETSGKWENTLTGDLSFLGGDLDFDLKAFKVASTVNGVSVHGDSSVEIDIGNEFTLDSDTFKLTTKGSLAQAAINSATTFTVVGTGTGGFTSDVDGTHSIFANNLVSFKATDEVKLTAFDDILITAETAFAQSAQLDFTSNAEYYQLESQSFTATNQNTLAFTSTIFNLFSFSDTTISSDAKLTLSDSRTSPSQINFVSQGTMAFTGQTYAAAARQENISFLSDGDDNVAGGIDIDATATFDADSAKLAVTAKRDARLLFTGGTFSVTAVNGGSFNVNSFGQDGIQLLAQNDVKFVGTGTGSYTTETGNIEFTSPTKIESNSVTTTEFNTFGEKGDIRTESTVTTFSAADNIFIQQRAYDSGAAYPDLINDSEDGLIRFDANQLTLTSGTELNFISDSDIDFTWYQTGATLWSAPTIDIDAGLLSDFYGYKSVGITSTNTADYRATGSLNAQINTRSNAITYNTPNHRITATSRANFIANTGSIEFINSARVDIDHTASPLFDIVMEAHRDDFRIVDTGNGDQFTPSRDFKILATGNEGVLSFTSATTTLTTANAYLTADDSFFAPFNNFQPTGGLIVESARDVIFEAADTLNVSGNNGISFETVNDGQFLIDVAGAYSSFATATSMSFVAEGMLGTIGGRYVLEDSYWFTTLTQDIKHKINRNTNGIEITNVDSPLLVDANDELFITSCQGSVEFRARDTIRYFVPNATGRILFFGLPATGVNGQHTAVPYARSTDYCLGDTGCNELSRCGSYDGGTCPGATCALNCRELSAVINEITQAMVAYGLLNCSVDTTWCTVIFP